MRQAVVLIHGIGEKKPLDTLRNFVKFVFKGIQFRSKPDKMNESFELRRLQMPSTRNRPITEFYEYYWAHHLRDTNLSMVIAWLKSIFLRKPKDISKKLRPFFYIGWFLLLASVFLLSTSNIISSLSNGLGSSWKLLGSLVLIIFEFFMINLINRYIGDAARYLNPLPDNIEQRNKIRKEGIALLKSLHLSKKYDRIIIVGHSLGSVIGYDLIRHYWATFNFPDKPSVIKQVELKNFKWEVRNLSNDNNISMEQKVDNFQAAQHRLWKEYKSIGINWLITDFITLGSPLAHASMLLAEDSNDFERKKKEREYPTCPPYNSSSEDFFYNSKFDANGVPRTIRRPDHSSPFSCTRWTNLFFPHRKLFIGDLIAGPIVPIFGLGIKDIPVQLKGIKNSWLSHVNYWSEEGKDSIKKNYSHPLEMLCKALKLEE
ncbi:MAG: hypothetical protein ACM3SY_15635 [Candidatus Omnitrophota bacterium]